MEHHDYEQVNTYNEHNNTYDDLTIKNHELFYFIIIIFGIILLFQLFLLFFFIFKIINIRYKRTILETEMGQLQSILDNEELTNLIKN